jgi:UPF0755 protein
MTVRRKSFFALILLLAGIICIASFLLYRTVSTYEIPPCEDRYLVIPSGATLKEVSFHLRDEGYIRHPHIFTILVTLMGKEGNIHAGAYCFEGKTSILRIAKDITQGRVATKQVTIPEGLNYAGIAEIVMESIGGDTAEYKGFESDPELLGHIGLEINRLEGFLFPDTYIVPADITPKNFLRTMITRYHEVFDDSLRERAREIGFSEIEVVTLASIIEKETRLESERRTISGVFHNRLKRGIALEADPTVRYALSKYKGRLLYKDLEVDSPYNTYRHRDLPPGPICSPGKASILAALYPDEVDYYYFVAAGDGSHIFSRTLAQHNRARKRVPISE